MYLTTYLYKNISIVRCISRHTDIPLMPIRSAHSFFQHNLPDEGGDKNTEFSKFKTIKLCVSESISIQTFALIPKSFRLYLDTNILLFFTLRSSCSKSGTNQTLRIMSIAIWQISISNPHINGKHKAKRMNFTHQFCPKRIMVLI